MAIKKEMFEKNKQAFQEFYGKTWDKEPALYTEFLKTQLMSELVDIVYQWADKSLKKQDSIIQVLTGIEKRKP